MTSQEPLSLDTQATLLLCGRFPGSKDDDIRPLTLIEYNQLAKELLARSLRPADLLSNLPDGLALDSITPERLTRLIRRGAAMALALERWSQSGIGVLGRSDSAYPVRLRTILKASAPPILFIAGNTELLGLDAVCVVGSRDATESGIKFARALGTTCAAENLAVVSGDARGVDREAMSGALESGGKVIGILADGLGKAVLSKRNRQELMRGALILASPFSPEAPFTVAHAMDRNKYLYAMSLAAIVVDSDLKGGTWSGAVENHKRNWVPAFVRIGNDVREGNHKLAELGLCPLTEEDMTRRSSLRALLTQKVPERTPRAGKPGPSTQLLFGKSTPNSGEAARLENDHPSPREPFGKKQPEEVTSEPAPATVRTWSRDADELFEFFVAQLTLLLEIEPRSEQQVAEHFAIECTQARRWLEKACERHLIARKGSPPQYVLERLSH
jgi:predicted Rossmann fold nucleotide-binding protein DprA/Smf involved in DNA uptake